MAWETASALPEPVACASAAASACGVVGGKGEGGSNPWGGMGVRDMRMAGGGGEAAPPTQGPRAPDTNLRVGLLQPPAGICVCSVGLAGGGGISEAAGGA